MENNQMKTMNDNTMINIAGSVDTELSKAAINQLPGIYDVLKQGLDDYKEVKDSSTQAIVSMHQTASASSQERIKAYADLLKDPNTSPEERARMMALLEEESEHAKKLDETMPKKVQEIEKDYGDTIVKVGLILGGTVLLFGAPAAAYGVYRIYQSYKAR